MAKAKGEQKATETAAKTSRKKPAPYITPEIILNDEYKVKVTKFSFDLYRKRTKEDVDDDMPDDGEKEEGWVTLGFFQKNGWDRIRLEILNDLVRRKISKTQQLTLSEFAVVVEKVEKDIEKLFKKDAIFLDDDKSTTTKTKTKATKK